MKLLFSLAVILVLTVLGAHGQAIDPKKFNVQFKFTGVPDDVQAMVVSAAARWQEVITKGFGSTVTVRAGTKLCNQPVLAADLVVRDLFVFVSMESLDGIKGNLVRTGPCAFDNRNNVRLAQMQIDSADVQNLKDAGKLQSLLTHEMGHALGVGTTWDRKNLLLNAVAQRLLLFQGPNAGAGQGEVGGSGIPQVETSPIIGVGQIHWAESEYSNELMTPIISGNNQPLSRLTVRSLADLGYTVDVTKADDFNINAPNQQQVTPPPGGTYAPTTAQPPPANGACVGGPAFDPAGEPNVGNAAGRQFIGGQCRSSKDCASGCCALPCGICSGPGAQFQAGKQGCGFGDGPTNQPTTLAPTPPTAPPSKAPTTAGNNGGGGNQCVGGPAFDPAGVPNVGNAAGRQFIGGQCLSSRDCASGCCALPCGICSGPGAQFQAGKQGCGFGDFPTVQPTTPPPSNPTNAPTVFQGAVSDSARVNFLRDEAANLNDGVRVPLTDPRVIPTKRTRTADQGCAIIGNGFICADLARNVRCVNGKVAVNVANPFNQNNLLKACVGGFCAGSQTLTPGQNPCVQQPETAVAGNAALNEFFIPPSNSAGGRRLREMDEITSRELQTFYDGTPTKNDLNWEEGFSGDEVLADLVAEDDPEASKGSDSTGAIVGGIIGAFAFVGIAAFIVVRRRASEADSKPRVRDSQMMAGNPLYDMSVPASNAPVYDNSQYQNRQMQNYYGQNNNYQQSYQYTN